jgi:hypothetical protein
LERAKHEDVSRASLLPSTSIPIRVNLQKKLKPIRFLASFFYEILKNWMNCLVEENIFQKMSVPLAKTANVSPNYKLRLRMN